MSKKVVIVGGHGDIGLRLAQRLSANHSVSSIVRKKEYEADVRATSATPIILDLESSQTSEFTAAFEGVDVVYFTAGAGYNASDERTKNVDYGGALKVFDAIESVGGPKPRLILLSTFDANDPNKIPPHYDEADIKASKEIRKILGVYFHWKYQADKSLVQRNTFKWTIIRPGAFNDEPGTNKLFIGRTHVTGSISRDDVTEVLILLLNREDAAGLAIDIIGGGNTSIEEGLDAVIKKRETDFLG